MTTDNRTGPTRILFVDDEVSVLKSLQRGLRIHCRDLQARFCNSPEQALNLIADFQPWVVVSDKRMPEMDGSEFLRRVGETYPEVIRVMLTGDTSKDVALEVAEVTHMLIAKPFRIETLLETIHRATCLRNLPVSMQVRKQLGGIDSIPVLPKVYQELEDAIQRDDVDTQQVAVIIGQDPAILAKIIQLANSAFLGFSSQISTAHEATVRLGLELIKELVLCFGVFKKCEGVDEDLAEQLLAEAMAVATIARHLAIACDLDRQDVNNAFVLGLMHNVGALISSMSVVQLDQEGPAQQPEEEDVVGAYMLALWGLPPALVDATYYQNIPQDDPDQSVLCCILHTAKVIHQCHKAGTAVPTAEDLPLPLLQSQGLDSGVLVWLQQQSD